MNDNSQKTKISIIGTVGVPACYGGFESLVDNLLDFTPPNVEYTVFCSAPKYPDKLDSYKGARLIYLDRDANGISSIFYDYECMKRSIALGADIMLVLGVSGCIFLSQIRRKFKGKIITNIDGLEWKRAKWKFYAKWLLHFSERQAVKYSDVVIGDNKGITDYVKDAYKKDAVLIAYGGDHVAKNEDDSLFDEYPFARGKYAITVCRIEPENNIHVILEAFARLNSERVKMPLVIVGNWDKSEYGRELKEKYAAQSKTLNSQFSTINLLDSIYEPHKINWLRSHASLYVHGHSAGGTNPSLVEAMNFGLPILAFDCVYNRATTEEKCLYWKTASDIEKLISENQSDFPKIAGDMEEAGKRLYSWKKIAGQYNELWK